MSDRDESRSALSHDVGLHYAGLPRPRDIGAYGVDDSAALLRRYELVLRKLVYLQAGNFPGRAFWELKVALGRHLYEDADDDVRKRLIDKMRVRQEEMTAAELVAGVIWLKQDQPWEFTLDLARHCWDEVRHALFGQAALETEGIDWMSYPQYTSDYDVNITNLPAAQYAWLSIGIEGGAMKRTGKRAEYEFCRDEAHHPLMTPRWRSLL